MFYSLIRVTLFGGSSLPENRRMRFEDLFVGQDYREVITFTQTAVAAFAELTGDRNPLHLDPVFARGSRFGAPIAHGMLAAGFVSAILGVHLPGPGSVYIGQTFRFRKPVYVGQAVAIRVQVTELDPARRRVTLTTVGQDPQQVTLFDGEATMLVE